MAYFNQSNLSSYDIVDQIQTVNRFSEGFLGLWIVIAVIVLAWLAMSVKYNTQSALVAAMWLGSLTGWFLILLQILSVDLWIIQVSATALLSVAVWVTQNRK